MHVSYNRQIVIYDQYFDTYSLDFTRRPASFPNAFGVSVPSSLPLPLLKTLAMETFDGALWTGSSFSSILFTLK